MNHDCFWSQAISGHTQKETKSVNALKTRHETKNNQNNISRVLHKSLVKTKFC
jgi:hypothetical protein